MGTDGYHITFDSPVALWGQIGEGVEDDLGMEWRWGRNRRMELSRKRLGGGQTGGGVYAGISGGDK